MQNNLTKQLTAIIVDDEPAACKNLKNVLLEYVDPSIKILGLANSTNEVEQLLKTHKPDVIFIDIEMPEENGFQFLQRIFPFDFEVIFVTGYDAYAIKAFKLNAVDYILKPLSVNEIRAAVLRLKERLSLKGYRADNNINNISITPVKNKEYAQKICLRDQHNIISVNLKDIHFIEARRGYSKVYFDEGNLERQMVLSQSISEYEELLPAEMFCRIHRSYLINFQHLKAVVRKDHNAVVINGKHNLPISRRRYAHLMELMKNENIARF